MRDEISGDLSRRGSDSPFIRHSPKRQVLLLGNAYGKPFGGRTVFLFWSLISIIGAVALMFLKEKAIENPERFEIAGQNPKAGAAAKA